MFKIERSGEYVKVNGLRHEVEEFARVLRGCVLRGKPHDRVICRLASKLDVMAKKDIETTSFRMDHVDKYLDIIIREVVPANFIDIKYKEVKDITKVTLDPGKIYGSKLNTNMDVYVVNFDIFKNLKPKFVPKEVEVKLSTIDEL